MCAVHTRTTESKKRKRESVEDDDIEDLEFPDFKQIKLSQVDQKPLKIIFDIQQSEVGDLMDIEKDKESKQEKKAETESQKDIKETKSSDEKPATKPTQATQDVSQEEKEKERILQKAESDVEAFINTCLWEYNRQKKQTKSSSKLDEIIDLVEKQNQEIADPNFEARPPPHVLNDLEVSLVIKLYPEYFTLEAPKAQKEPNKLAYTPATRAFLREIASCRLAQDLLEEIQDFPCTFYDGSIVVEVMDLRTDETKKQNATTKQNGVTHRLLLRPEPESFHRDINQFIDENYPNMDDEQRLKIMQRVLMATKNELCLTPDPFVCRVANVLHYNIQKHNFRRRRRTRAKELLSLARRKVEHNLLSYIISNGWNTSTNRLFMEEKPPSSIPLAQKKPTPIGDISNPMQFLQKMEKIPFNNKPPNRTRMLKFQATHDKSRIWKIEIVPVLNGKRYDCILSPSREQPSRWAIGGRHATDLYVKRLKDMFTSNGKTKCMVDQEVDIAQYHYRAAHGATQIVAPFTYQPGMHGQHVIGQPIAGSPAAMQGRQPGVPTRQPGMPGVPTAPGIPAGYPQYRQPAGLHPQQAAQTIATSLARGQIARMPTGQAIPGRFPNGTIPTAMYNPALSINIRPTQPGGINAAAARVPMGHPTTTNYPQNAYAGKRTT